MDADDCCGLPDLGLASIAENLRRRYDHDQIYTSLGLVLLSVNPNKPVKCYSSSVRDAVAAGLYRQPHVYSQVTRAVREMYRLKQADSTVVVAGQSGSGKTENTRLMVDMLVHLQATRDQGRMARISEQLSAAGDLLEAFGNAKTRLNRNSSRFGRLTTVNLRQEFQIAGTALMVFLLETSRVAHVVDGEQTFHVLQSLSMDKRFEGPVYTRWPQVSANLLKCDINPKPVKDVLDATLLLRDLTFESPVGDVARLLRLDEADLERHLKVKQVRDVSRLAYPGEFDLLRVRLSQTVYQWLFQYLVNRLNQQRCDAEYHLNILDIFGFESFDSNSFEQLCINYANEELHRLFYDSVVLGELEEMRREGIRASLNFDISSKYRGGELTIFTDPVSGIFAKLNDATKTKLPLQKKESWFLHQVKHSSTDRPHLVGKECFVVEHFVGMVEYTSGSFVSKNAQSISGSNRILLQAKNIVFDDFKVTNETTLETYTANVSVLVNTLSGSKCHFVRCVKPNEADVADAFDYDFVLNQLRNLGAEQVVQVMHKGFPVRLPLSSLRAKNEGLAVLSPPSAARVLMNMMKCPKTDFSIGATKLFLKQQHLEALLAGFEDVDGLRALIVASHSDYIRLRWKVVTSSIRFLLRLKRLQRQRRAATAVQALWKGSVVRRGLRSIRNALHILGLRVCSAKTIQRCWKRRAARQCTGSVKEHQEAAGTAKQPDSCREHSVRRQPKARSKNTSSPPTQPLSHALPPRPRLKRAVRPPKLNVRAPTSDQRRIRELESENQYLRISSGNHWSVLAEMLNEIQRLRDDIAGLTENHRPQAARAGPRRRSRRRSRNQRG
ncbi:MAG: hypothetical protein KVP17_002012 [Porospora cf. gigantea B]|uniref:uncharacterized protein n=1 Tax=Porospora cf. gigantea B TaxID=2853592 RepID=UPI003571F863|nr:MAG: hypothetical protein KVP17_002012 [Porospora cf. gigantea B]